VLRGSSITWHPLGWSRLRAGDDRQVLVVGHDAQAWRFFDQVQLHRELADLALKRSDLGFAFRNDRCFGLFGAELAPVVLRQPQLNQIGRQGVLVDRVYFLAASRRPMAPLRMSWHCWILNFGAWRRYGPLDDMTFSWF